MRFPNTRSLIVGALGALATLCAAGAPSAASADVIWLVNGTFDDGATLTGTFTINVYGYIESNFDLTTTVGQVLTAFDYTKANAYFASGAAPDPTLVDFFPSYFGDLHLQFADSLSSPEAHNDIVLGGVSYECQASYSCGAPPTGGDIRYLVSGFAEEVPEPATWALMLVGLAGVGYAARRRGGMVPA